LFASEQAVSRPHGQAVEKHGMTNVAYWTLADGQPDAERTLVYILAHDSQDATKASFGKFRAKTPIGSPPAPHQKRKPADR
jgi:hypothetical protein